MVSLVDVANMYCDYTFKGEDDVKKASKIRWKKRIQEYYNPRNQLDRKRRGSGDTMVKLIIFTQHILDGCVKKHDLKALKEKNIILEKKVKELTEKVNSLQEYIGEEQIWVDGVEYFWNPVTKELLDVDDGTMVGVYNTDNGGSPIFKTEYFAEYHIYKKFSNNMKKKENVQSE